VKILGFKNRVPWSRSGLPVGIFFTKNPNLGKFYTALKWKMLHCMVIWYIYIKTFGTFCGHWEYITAIWHILRPSGICCLWSFGILFHVLVCYT
jgi:hypothetical protein